MYLTPEERAVGKENFQAAVGSAAVRRDRMKETVKREVRSGKGLGSLYYGYGDSVPKPVRVGVIGTGDEGSVLIGAINRDFVTVKSIADIRPYNIWRAFHGDYYGGAHAVRPGLLSVYDWKTEAEARKNVKVYGAYEELIARAKDDDIEAVIIALPLHLHAGAAIAAMRAGLHVLTEKLMGHSVAECKEMAREAATTKRILATGHQRHYNILYDNSVALIGKGLLGELHSIRAQWHRGNLPLPGKDSWAQPMPRAAKPDDPQAGLLEKHLHDWQAALEELKRASDIPKSDWEKQVALAKARIEQVRAQIGDVVDAAQYGYMDRETKNGEGKVIYRRPAIEELIRWRLWNRTGAGLMAELGSHQLDAAGIFVAAAHGGKKQHPLSVVASAGQPLFPPDRDVEDHVYCIFEFPAPGYDAEDPIACRKRIGVQYASINGNGFGGYGETVFGTEGTLLLESEKDAMLYKTHETASKTKAVAVDKGKASLRVDEAGDPESAAFGALGTLPADRGYTEEIEHWAWCIRNPAPENQPRCGPKVALGDAVIALAANQAARSGARIEFREGWFDVASDETPEDVKPNLGRYT